MAGPSRLIAAILFACLLQKANTQSEVDEGGSCPEKLTLDGSCLLPPGRGGSRSGAILFSSELEAFTAARCYAICVQNNTGSDVSKV